MILSYFVLIDSLLFATENILLCVCVRIKWLMEAPSSGITEVLHLNFFVTKLMNIDNYTTVGNFWPIRGLHFIVIWGISHLTQHGLIWLAWMHTWHKLVHTLVFVEMKFNPRQASDKFHINKNAEVNWYLVNMLYLRHLNLCDVIWFQHVMVIAILSKYPSIKLKRYCDSS